MSRSSTRFSRPPREGSSVPSKASNETNDTEACDPPPVPPNRNIDYYNLTKGDISHANSSSESLDAQIQRKPRNVPDYYDLTKGDITHDDSSIESILSHSPNNPLHHDTPKTQQPARRQPTKPNPKTSDANGSSDSLTLEPERAMKYERSRGWNFLRPKAEPLARTGRPRSDRPSNTTPDRSRPTTPNFSRPFGHGRRDSHATLDTVAESRSERGWPPSAAAAARASTMTTDTPRFAPPQRDRFSSRGLYSLNNATPRPDLSRSINTNISPPHGGPRPTILPRTTPLVSSPKLPRTTNPLAQNPTDESLSSPTSPNATLPTPPSPKVPQGHSHKPSTSIINSTVPTPRPTDPRNTATLPKPNTSNQHPRNTPPQTPTSPTTTKSPRKSLLRRRSTHKQAPSAPIPTSSTAATDAPRDPQPAESATATRRKSILGQRTSTITSNSNRIPPASIRSEAAASSAVASRDRGWRSWSMKTRGTSPVREAAVGRRNTVTEWEGRDLKMEPRTKQAASSAGGGVREVPVSGERLERLKERGINPALYVEMKAEPRRKSRFRLPGMFSSAFTS